MSSQNSHSLRSFGVLATAGILAAGAMTSGFFYMKNREAGLTQLRELVVKDGLSMGTQVKSHVDGHERGMRALRELLAHNPQMKEEEIRDVIPQLFPGSLARSTVLVLAGGGKGDAPARQEVAVALGQGLPKLAKGESLADNATGKAVLPILEEGGSGKCFAKFLKLPLEGGTSLPALVIAGRTGAEKPGGAQAVVGVFSLDEMIEGALDPAVTLSYDVVAYAEPQPFQRDLMYFSAASYREQNLLPSYSDLHESTSQRYSLTVGDARVFLNFTPTPQWMRRNDNPLPKVIFFLGLATTGVLASLFVYKSRRASVVEDLVQERTAELALANLRLDESRGTFSSLLEACPDAINGKDNQGRWTFANRAFLELAGINENFPYKGLKDDEIIARARPANLRFLQLRAALDRRVLGDGQGLREELTIETTGQPRRHLDIHMLPVRGNDGGTVGLVAVCNDITELRRRINALQRSRERVKLLVENTATAIVEWDDEFRLIHWNPAAARLFGHDWEEVRNKPISFFADPDGGEVAASALDSFLREREKTIPQSFRHRTRRGNLLTCEWQNTPLIDEDGRPLGVTSFIYDVTERTKAEQALRKRDGILRGLAGSAIGFLNADSWEQEAGEMLRHLVDSLALSRVSLVRVPPNDPAAATYTVLQWTNPYWEGTGDGEAEAATGDVNAELVRAGLATQLSDKGGLFGPCATLPAPWGPLLAGQGTRSVLILPMSLQGEIWGFLRFDDCRVHREWSADEVDALRVVAGVLAGAIARQILTKDRLQMEKRLLLSQKRESLGLLAGGIARDFNQLIDDILGNASLGRTLAETDSTIDLCLSSIEEHGLRAASLCREMLAYAGHGETQTGLASPNLIILDVLNGLDPEHQRRIHFRKDLANGIPVVEMEVDQMREAIRAIVQNAIEAIGNQTGVIDIHTRAATRQPGADGAEILIRDSGPGMDLQTRDRVFDPFFSTKMSGRGLGLTIAQSIVEAHGGQITMESEAGRGTSVLISLPLHRPKPGLAETPASPASMGGLVLLVHSGRAADRATALAFQQLGFDIEECVGVDHALRLLKDHPNRHRLVAVDPAAPGAEAPTLHRLRRAAGAASVILLASGNECPPSLRHFAAEGLATLLPDALSAESLKGAVTSALANNGNG